MFLVRFFFTVTCGTLKLAILSMIGLILLDYTADAATSLQQKLSTPEGAILLSHAEKLYDSAVTRVEAVDWSKMSNDVTQLARSIEIKTGSTR